jgi:hypothetical protein
VTRTPIAPGEVLLRRVPPCTDKVVRRKIDDQGVLRPASSATSTRENEEYLSCSRLQITSPRQLLEQLDDSTGWGVCCFRARDVQTLSDGGGGHLTLRHEPEENDPGHAGIYSAGFRPYPQAKSPAKHLAKVARMLTDDELQRLRPGESVETSNGITGETTFS